MWDVEWDDENEPKWERINISELVDRINRIWFNNKQNMVAECISKLNFQI